MKHWMITLGILVVLLAAGCGGGNGTPTPETGDPEVGITEYPAIEAPLAVTGSHAVSTVPGQVKVLTGASPEELPAIVGRYGCQVAYQHGGWATLDLPMGMDLNTAVRLLEKEYNIIQVEPLYQINTARISESSDSLRTANMIPLDPFAGEQFVGDLRYDAGGDAWYITRFRGQGLAYFSMDFNAAWDVAYADAMVADEPVVIALIDGGWYDYTTPGNVRGSLSGVAFDDANSGFMAADGTFTAGMAAAEWDLYIEELGTAPDNWYRYSPYRYEGETMLGMLAARINDYQAWASVDLDASGTITEDDVWNEGIAGINPNATYILIKTGALDVDTWSFNDNHIAYSINHAVTAGADIILLGMWGLGAVGSNVSTAIQNARNNDVLVIAPAGDVVDSYNSDLEPPGFDDAPVDITVANVTPASDPNCVAVACTGPNKINRPDQLPDIDFDPPGPGEEDVENFGTGWDPGFFSEPFHNSYAEVANYSNTGADIAAMGFGIGFSIHPRLISTGDGSQGDPYVYIPGEPYRTNNIARFTTIHAASYVAGAASQVFQTLSEINGTPPTDDEVLNELLSTVDFPGMTGLVGTGGYLNAGAAIRSAVNGGNLQTIIPALAIDYVQLSQPLPAVTRGTDVSATTHILNGTAPYELTVDWGNGEDPDVYSNWNSGDPVELSGGYETLGLEGINITVTDADDQEVNIGFAIYVINPIAVGITIEDASGTAVNPAALMAGTAYRFRANATNVFTGDIGGTSNTTTFSWDFNDDGTEDATGPSPSYTYPSPLPNATVRLTVIEDVRPGTEATIDVNVS